MFFGVVRKEVVFIEWKNVFVKYVFRKGLVFGVYKEFL